MPEATESSHDRLALRVENLGFGHHMDNNPGHWSSSDVADGARRS